MLRSAKSAFSVAGLLALAGCLVTNELDFAASQNLPTIKPVSPPPTSYVPVPADDFCMQSGVDKAVRIQARYLDDDVDQDLWVQAFANGVPVPSVNGSTSFLQAFGNTGAAEHEAPPLCVPWTLLTQNCNVVRVFVADNFSAIARPLDQLLADSKVDSAIWYLGPRAADSDGAPAMPDISFTDCLPALDGGT